MTDMKKTQPIPPPTAADVLEVFGHFSEGLLERIDERDENVLKIIQQFVSDILAQYERATKRSDDHEKRIVANSRDIEELRRKQNEFASEFKRSSSGCAILVSVKAGRVRPRVDTRTRRSRTRT